jgi:DNA-directed RNA polymerase subunit RPC12/RpoP
MSEFKFSCPTCGQHVRGDLSYAGKPYQCPVCQTEFVIPNPKSATSLRLETDQWIAPPTQAHSAPASATARMTIPLPPPPKGEAPAPDRSPPPVPSRLSGWAIAAAVFGLVPVIGCVPAILCGHWARTQTAKDANLGGRNLALVGLVLGYAWMGLTILGLGLWFSWHH